MQNKINLRALFAIFTTTFALAIHLPSSHATETSPDEIKKLVTANRAVKYWVNFGKLDEIKGMSKESSFPSEILSFSPQVFKMEDSIRVKVLIDYSYKFNDNQSKVVELAINCNKNKFRILNEVGFENHKAQGKSINENMAFVIMEEEKELMNIPSSNKHEIVFFRDIPSFLLAKLKGLICKNS